MMASAFFLLGIFIDGLLFLHMQIFPVDVKSGAMLIVGTDGLFDNMFERQIRNIARLGAEVGLYPEQVAWAISQFNEEESLYTIYESC
jgi:serine/threonine protein phosphatase PrpC